MVSKRRDTIVFYVRADMTLINRPPRRSVRFLCLSRNKVCNGRYKVVKPKSEVVSENFQRIEEKYGNQNVRLSMTRRDFFRETKIWIY